MANFFDKAIPHIAFVTSVAGASHIKNEKPCQDSSVCVTDKKYILTVVCDGHGGEDYFRSDMGSGFAVNAAVECISNKDVLAVLKKASEDKVREECILQLKKSIVAKWNDLVFAHFEQNPFAEIELAEASEKARGRYESGEQIESAYGSTLIASLLTDDFWLGLQIGDGNCAVFDGAEFSHPVPLDEKCFLNVTTSLCDKDAVNEFHHVFLTEPPTAVFIGTDGIDDCFAGNDGLHDFYKTVMRQMTDTHDTDTLKTAQAELVDYLPRMSEKGSGDDMSIGFIIRR